MNSDYNSTILRNIKNSLDLECYKAALIDIKRLLSEPRYAPEDRLKAIKAVMNIINEVLEDE